MERRSSVILGPGFYSTEEKNADKNESFISLYTDIKAEYVRYIHRLCVLFDLDGIKSFIWNDYKRKLEKRGINIKHNQGYQ